MNLWLKDPKSKEPSVTLTMFVLGFIVAIAKLAISGFVIGGISIEKFTGGDFAAAVAALGGVYVLRRNLNSNKSASKE